MEPNYKVTLLKGSCLVRAGRLWPYMTFNDTNTMPKKTPKKQTQQMLLVSTKLQD